MRKKNKIYLAVAAIAALPVVGYGVTHFSAFVLPLEEHNVFYYVFFTLFLVAVLLAVPYYMIKILGHAAHLRNKDEKEITLKDLPKDKEQLIKSKA